MPNPTAAMLVIGDEILSGRTRDSNMHHLAQEFTRHGIDLREVRMVSDDRAAIVAAVNALRQAFDHVVTSGGIGPTHDDITASSLTEMNEARLRMARIPDGATLIDNPISAAPGFSLGNVHVMAGVPQIFEAMVASLLSTLVGGAPLLSQTLRVQRGEGMVAEPLGALAEEFSDLQFGSYPFQKDGIFGTNVVVRGTDAGRLDAAMTRLNALFGD